MSPEEKKKELIGKFEQNKKASKVKEYKSFADINIQISEEAVEYWRNNS